VGARLAVVLTVVAVVWSILIVVVPVVRSPTLTAVVYAGSSRICHQRPERSFHIASTQMPVCARCAGLYVTGAAGALLGWLFSRRLPLRRRQLLLLAAALPTAVTWTLEWLGIMPFTNIVRALAALPLGLAAGWVFVQVLRYDAQLDGLEIHNSRPRARRL
jgi:uncharacterized membrane protein